jgi:pantoate--beta-alanine ligase
MGIRICSSPTVREQNGLAMSSRNRRLTPERREEAKLIYELLQWTKSNFSSHAIVDLKEMVVQKLSKTPAFELDYFEIAVEYNLRTANSKKEGVSYRVFIAVVVDGIRLIDNMSLN